MKRQNIIRSAREDADMSMQEVENLLARLCSANRDVIPIASERLGRIERGDAPALPEEIYSLSVAYDNPALCFEFCSEVCGLGEKIVPALGKNENLCSITCALLGSVREFEEMEKKLTILAQDGEIDCLEEREFDKIMDVLEKISSNVQTMKFWAQTHVKNK